jgi:hypothetical protein
MAHRNRRWAGVEVLAEGKSSWESHTARGGFRLGCIV